MSEERKNNKYFNEEFSNEIDNIINDYKNQFEILKNKSNLILNYSKRNLSNLEEDYKINENYSPTQNFNVELKNDNLKLQKENTNLKFKYNQLIESLKEKENLLNLLSEKNNDLENQILEYKNQLIENEKVDEELNNKSLKIPFPKKKKIKEEKDIERKIINYFFDFFNSNINLFKNSQILNSETKIKFDEENKEKNEKNSLYIISILNSFLNKIMKDNQEMFNELMKYKDIIDIQHSNIKNVTQDSLEDIKQENIMLKKQLSTFINENQDEINIEFEDKCNKEIKKNKSEINMEKYYENIKNLNIEKEKINNSIKFDENIIHPVYSMNNIDSNNLQRNILNHQFFTNNNSSKSSVENLFNNSNLNSSINNNKKHEIHSSQSLNTLNNPIQRLKKKIYDLEKRIKESND
jgi:hypothetical protein